jgi:DNA (cytosine-5)-methyltransferase 1
MEPTVLDLFSGIGGLSLAARWAGCRTVRFCEIDPFCRQVLAKNFPGVPIDEDVTKFDAQSLRGTIDIITGGFPCQPFSVAGKREGEDDDRFLWPSLLRIIRECRPAFLLLENVPGLRTISADRILQELAEADYACRAFVVGADDVGATHRRKRVWIVGRLADTDSQPDKWGSEPPFALSASRETWSELIGSGRVMADTNGISEQEPGDASLSGREGWDARFEPGSLRQYVPGARNGVGPFPPARNDYRRWTTVASVDPTYMPAVEREVRRVADGLPGGLDGRDQRSVAKETRQGISQASRNRTAQLRALGNAVVPQVAYPFLRWIREQLESEAR